MRFSVAGGSIRGGREYQEDYWLAYDLSSRKLATCLPRKPHSISGASTGLSVVVADGVGGGGNGDVASKLVAESFTPKIFAGRGSRVEALGDALLAANSELAELKGKNSNYSSMMGTTLIAGFFNEETLCFLSVGDSSIFRFRDEEMHLVNLHHEYGLELDSGVSAGRLEWDEVRSDRNRSAITSAVTGGLVEKFQTGERRLESGDIYIFASDGIEVLPNQLIRRLVYQHRDEGVESIVFALMEMADKHGEAYASGRHDNITAVVVECE